jgi:hypothetical protein
MDGVISRPLVELSIDERVQSLAELLAVGLLRLQQRRLLASARDLPASANPAETSAACLEVAAETVLSVLHELTGRDQPEEHTC